jgi:hypothetical protein
MSEILLYPSPDICDSRQRPVHGELKIINSKLELATLNRLDLELFYNRVGLGYDHPENLSLRNTLETYIGREEVKTYYVSVKNGGEEDNILMIVTGQVELKNDGSQNKSNLMLTSVIYDKAHLSKGDIKVALSEIEYRAKIQGFEKLSILTTPDNNFEMAQLLKSYTRSYVDGISTLHQKYLNSETK